MLRDYHGNPLKFKGSATVTGFPLYLGTEVPFWELSNSTLFNIPHDMVPILIGLALEK